MKTLFAFIIICAFALANVQGNAGCYYNSNYGAASCFAASESAGDWHIYSAGATWYIPANRTIFYCASVNLPINYGIATVYFGPWTWHVQRTNDPIFDTQNVQDGAYGTVDSNFEAPWYTWTVGVSVWYGTANFTCSW